MFVDPKPRTFYIAPKQPGAVSMVMPELPIPQSNMNAILYDKNSPTKLMDTPVSDLAPKCLTGYQLADKDTYKGSIVSRAKKVSPTSTSEFKLARARANNIGYREQAENMAATEVAATQESSRSRFQVQQLEAGTVLYFRAQAEVLQLSLHVLVQWRSLPHGHQQA